MQDDPPPQGADAHASDGTSPPAPFVEATCPGCRLAAALEPAEPEARWRCPGCGAGHLLGDVGVLWMHVEGEMRPHRQWWAWGGPGTFTPDAEARLRALWGSFWADPPRGDVGGPGPGSRARRRRRRG